MDDELHKAISYKAKQRAGTTTPWNIDRMISYLIGTTAAAEAIWELQHNSGMGRESKHVAILLARLTTEC